MFGKRLHWWFEVHKDVHYGKENGVIFNVWWRNLWNPVYCFCVIHRREQIQKLFICICEISKRFAFALTKWLYAHKLRKFEFMDYQILQGRNSSFCCKNVLWHDRKKDSSATVIHFTHFFNLLAILYFVKVGSIIIVILNLHPFVEWS